MELPIGTDGSELARLIANGIAPCKLLNTLVANSVPDGELNFIVTDDTDRRENLRLCIDSAKKVGCDVSAVDVSAILQLKVIVCLVFTRLLLN